jgi:hypothetical protein
MTYIFFPAQKEVKNIMKRFLSILLCLMLLFGCVSTAALASEEAEEISEAAETTESEVLAQDPEEAPVQDGTTASGAFGSLTWALEEGTLTISGTGAMDNYTSSTASSVPWNDHRESITAVVIESGVTTIGARVFDSCTSLVSVTVPDGVTAIGTGAFYGCTSLKNITLPASVTAIGNYAFENCTALSGITIPANVTSIGICAFGNCSSLRSVTVPAAVTSIGEGAFSNCNSLFAVSILNAECSIAESGSKNTLGVQGKTTIYGYANSTAHTYATTYDYEFVADPDANTTGGSHTIEDELGTPPENPTTSGIIDGTDITWTVEDGVLTVSGTGAIPDYDNLAAPWRDCWAITKKIVISGGITEIGSYAFSPMPYVTAVTVDEGVTAIGTGAFRYCDRLETIALPSTMETLGSAFISVTGDSALQTITVASREGYELVGWLDINGGLWSTDDIAAGETAEAGALTAQWRADEDSTAEKVFTDVTQDDWFYNEVMYCNKNGLMTGISDTEFSPRTYGTRAQVVTVLYRLAGEPAVTASTEFTDIPADQYYTDAVTWAEANGITTGYEDGTFRPNREVTRQEFITFLYRYLIDSDADSNDYANAGSINAFADGDKVQDWATEAENWSIIVGLQTGYEVDSLTYLRPDSSIRRSEIATFLYRCTTTQQDNRTVAESLIGQDVSALIAAIGEPDETEYTASCLVYYAEDGLLYYGDLVISTLRYSNGTELIVGVY